jgi:hypothetical protein
VSYLSLGLEYRTEYEYFDNWMLGAGPQDHNGYLLIRVMLHLDLHAGSDLRLFSELEFDYVAGRAGGPRPGRDRMCSKRKPSTVANRLQAPNLRRPGSPRAFASS